LAVYVFWKLGRKFFKKAEDPEHSEIPSELSRVSYLIEILNNKYVFSILRSWKRRLSTTVVSSA